MPEPSYYQILGVDPQSSEEDIEAAYRSLLSENFTADGSYKPGAKDTVEMINRAYVVLTDPVRRKQYDYELFWGKKDPEAAAAGDAQPAERAEQVPEWLADLAGEEQKKEDEQIPAWISAAKSVQDESYRASAASRNSRGVIFLALSLLLILITLFVLIQMMR